MMNFVEGPSLPKWLQDEFPYRRRLFQNGHNTIHFVDDGEGPVVILQHGNPTWSYLWRKVIGLLLQNRVRVIAPDLIGLGLSSKPRDIKTHSLSFHADQIAALIKALNLNDVTIVGQDWGGPTIALAAAQIPQRIKGAVFANTSLLSPRRTPKLHIFNQFANLPLISDLVFRLFNYPIPLLYLYQADRNSMGSREIRAYGYPLRRFRDRIAPLALARMVPTNLAHPSCGDFQVTEKWARSFRAPVRLVWGMNDPILGAVALPSMKWLFRKADLAVTETQAGHFLQEEVPQILAQAILEVVFSSPQVE